MYIRVLILLTILAAGPAYAQKTIAVDEQTWLSAAGQIRLSRHWGVWYDAHMRFKEDFIGAPSQFIIRTGPTWYINDDVRLTAAYAYIHTFPGAGHANISVPEHRPWQQIQWMTRSKKLNLTQSIRLEERFRRNVLNDDALAAGYQFSWRFRYNMALFIPLTKKGFAPGGLQAMLNNEVFVNAGKNIVYHHFDQNRFFVGLAYPFTRLIQVQVGYMNLFQQLPSGNQFREFHALRVGYVHNVDARKK